MTIAQFVERVRRLAQQRGLPLDPADIESALPLSLDTLARRVAKRSDFALLQKDFTVAISSGLADLSSHSDMLIDFISEVLHPAPATGITNEYFSRIPNGTSADLRILRLPFYWYYIVKDNRIEAMRGDGVTAPANGNLTVTANFTQGDITLLPAALDEDLVLVGFEMATGSEPVMEEAVA